MIELTLWNKDHPDATRVVEAPDTDSAGLLLAGAIQAAIDAKGTLVIEVKEHGN